MSPINCFDVFNLKANSQYHFRVTPRNRYGWGHSVQTSSPITVGGAECLPEFTKILPGQLKVLLGRDFILECVVKGTPRPKIVWYKDQIPIRDSADRLTMQMIGSGMCRLKIENVQSVHSGRYSCEATNSQGRVSTFARLQAVADYKIYEADNKLKAKINAETVNIFSTFVQIDISCFFFCAIRNYAKTLSHNLRCVYVIVAFRQLIRFG